jgi:hypothetical protein
MNEVPFAALVAGGSALLGLILGIANHLLSRTARIAAAQKQIADLYDKLVDYRRHHPEVLPLSRQWQAGSFHRIYFDETEKGRRWALYYGYVELCLGYANAVLYARKRRLIDRLSFQAHHKPLIKLLFTEHILILDEICQSGPYVSKLVRDFRRELEAEGWDWKTQFDQLPGAAPEPMP